MGFYGNITNVNKTQFTFDRTYPNRKTMEARLATDDIYLGRYVLIEYDTDNTHTLDTYLKCYVKAGTLGEEFYTSPTFDATTRVRWSSKNAAGEPSIAGTVVTDELIYVEKDLTPDDKNNILSQVFYKCTNGAGSTDGTVAQFKLVSTSESNYTKNYNIDIAVYGEGRGYDSTVWQKVYTQGTEKYVMIAELNSVVPTFDLSADAPTMTPITPHFDADSTNVYYKLHWQPQWGLRVAEADTENSDSTAIHRTTIYNPATGKTTTEEQTVNAAINFNMPAFDPQTSKGGVNIKKHDNGTNYFTINPTGMSGNEYNAHDGTGSKTQQVDIQEMRINLPAIGNMMSDAWDIIHGPNRDNARTDENGSLQGRLNSFKDIGSNQIPVKRSDDGTLVGTNINGNTPRTVTNITEESLHIEDKTQDDAWIKTVIDTSGLTDAKNSNNNGISIHHTFTSTPDTTSASNKNTDGVASDNASDKIELYVPYVDAAGHVVGKNVETITLPYGFKTIKTNGRGTSVEENATSDPTVTDIAADNTQDTLNINSGNEWIRIDTNANDDSITISHDIHTFDTTSADHTNLNKETDAKQEDNLTIYDWDYDEAGHIISKKEHTYTLPFGYKTIALGSASAAVAEIESNTTSLVADGTQDTLTIAPGNKWVRVAGTDDTLTVAHEVHDIESTPIENATVLDSGTGTFVIQDIAFDEAGHATSNKAHTYNLPFAIRNIDVTGSEAITAGTTADGKVEADSYNDTLTLNAQNRWINLKVENDTISVGHAAAGNEKTTAGDTAASTPDFGATFNVPYVKYDEMGHISSSGTRAVTIPQGSLADTASTKNTANVLTSIGFTPSSGAIVTEHKNVGTLELTNYSAVKTDDAAYVQSTDSINSAFKKVDTRIDNINTSLTNKINALDYTDTTATDQIVYGVSQTDGKIAIERKTVGELIISGYAKPTSISAGVSASDNINTAIGKLDYSLDKETSRATAEEGKIRNEFAQADGIITTNLNSEIARATQAEAALGSRIDALLDGVTEEELNTFKELSDALNDDTNFATTVNNAIAAVQTNLNTETANRTVAEQEINNRLTTIEGSSGIGISAKQIEQWNQAEKNVQSDWAQADDTADDYIKNKPTDLVRTNDIAEMAVKSDLTDMVVKSDIANMVEKTTTFTYTPEIVDETSGEITTPADLVTIDGLIAKIKLLESRITELEAKHEEEQTPEEPETPTE